MAYKNIIRNIVLIWVLFFTFPQTFASNITPDNWDLPYCDNNECGYQQWVQKVQWLIGEAETNQTLSQYIQNVVIYLLTFITIIAVIYIIYAWFRIMIWWWNDEAIKNSRKTIMNVAIWIVIIWLSYSIVAFIIDILDSSSNMA
jgi:hypothetical protein